MKCFKTVMIPEPHPRPTSSENLGMRHGRLSYVCYLVFKAHQVRRKPSQFEQPLA